MAQGRNIFTVPARSSTPQAPGVVDTSVGVGALGNLAASFGDLAAVVHRNEQ